MQLSDKLAAICVEIWDRYCHETDPSTRNLIATAYCDAKNAVEWLQRGGV